MNSSSTSSLCSRSDNETTSYSFGVVSSRNTEGGLVAPKDADVLMGRGKSINYHPGNVQFREMVTTRKVAYVTCPKHKKPDFAQLIVSELNARGARFLKQDGRTRKWYVVDHKQALLKTRQALREGAPVLCEKLIGKPQDKDSHPNEPKKRKHEEEEKGGDAQLNVLAATASGQQAAGSSIIQELLRKRSKVQASETATLPKAPLCLSSPISPLVRQLQTARQQRNALPCKESLILPSTDKAVLESHKQEKQQERNPKSPEQKARDIKREDEESVQVRARVEFLEAAARSTVASLGGASTNMTMRDSSGQAPFRLASPPLASVLMRDPMSFLVHSDRRLQPVHPTLLAQRQESTDRLTRPPLFISPHLSDARMLQNQDLLLLALLKNISPHLSHF